MIAFPAYRLLRLSNLAMITLGRHLIRQSSGYRLYFTGPEVKGRKPIETNVPAYLIGDFDRYLDDYRPFLLSRGGRQQPSGYDSLWVSKIGDPLHTAPSHRRSESIRGQRLEDICGCIFFRIRCDQRRNRGSKARPQHQKHSRSFEAVDFRKAL
jgi:hypothetical protein